MKERERVLELVKKRYSNVRRSVNFIRKIWQLKKMKKTNRKKAAEKSRYTKILEQQIKKIKSQI